MWLVVVGLSTACGGGSPTSPDGPAELKVTLDGFSRASGTLLTVGMEYRGEPGQRRGAVLSRINGKEMLLLNSVTFDGDVLRLQMPAPPEKNQTDMPFLLMRATGGKLEGHWMQNGTPMGPGLKLVRGHS